MYWLNNRKPKVWRHKQTIDATIGERPALVFEVGDNKEAQAVTSAIKKLTGENKADKKEA
jgi:hypothetical protein